MVTASEMGRKGGQARSEAKATAARNNASKPRGTWATAIAYELDNVAAFKAFGVVIVAGKIPRGHVKAHEWMTSMVREHGVGLKSETDLSFVQLSARSRMV